MTPTTSTRSVSAAGSARKITLRMNFPLMRFSFGSMARTNDGMPIVSALTSLSCAGVYGYGSVKIKITASATARYKKASKKITIRVVPKTPGLTRAVSPSANTVSIAWTRDRSVTGYQIYFSKTADFSKDTVQKMLGNGQSSVKLQGPPSGVKYYVKIRAYKKVGKKTIYSGWSAVKTVTIR